MRKDDVFEQPLANFVAKIVATEIEHRDEEKTLTFVIKIWVDGDVITARVKATEFEELNWVIKWAGHRAAIHPGHLTRQYVKAAIQLMSDRDAPAIHIHTQLGWQDVDGHKAFIHAGGAIGPGSPAPEFPLDVFTLKPKSIPDRPLENESAVGTSGTVQADKVSAVAIKVVLPTALEGYRLYGCSSRVDRVHLIRLAMAFLKIGPKRITLPLFMAVFRAVLGGTDFAIHLCGGTGSLKSTVASILLSFLGSRKGIAPQTTSWSSTANSNEILCHYAKDVIATIDDFLFRGSSSEMRQANREADRLIRALGNQMGRGRMNSGGSLREAKPPLCFLVSTGEAPFEGDSLNARALTLMVEPNDIKINGTLDYVKRLADLGVFSALTGSFIEWLAPSYDETFAFFQEHVEEIRHSLFHDKSLRVFAWQDRPHHHLRHISMISQLQAAWNLFLMFAHEHDAISDAEYEDMCQEGSEVLLDLLSSQSSSREQTEPTQVFLLHLASAVMTGQAHFAGSDGKAPEEDPEAWGWEKIVLPGVNADDGNADESAQEDGNRGPRDDSPVSCYRSKGTRIGWIAYDGLYLDPSTCLMVANRIGQGCNQVLPFNLHTLGVALKQKGLLASMDTGRKRTTVRINTQGRRVSVYHILKQSLLAPPCTQSYRFESGQPRPYDQDDVDNKLLGG